MPATYPVRVDAIALREVNDLSQDPLPIVRQHPTFIDPLYTLSHPCRSTPSMLGWTLVDNHPTQGRTFQRPLGVLEVWFLWHGLFNGTADGIQHCELHLLNGSQDAHLFSEANIVRAWLSTKRRYPLAGATMRGADSAPLRIKAATLKTAGGSGDNGTGFASEPHFVVREHDLAVLRPREIVFGSVSCAEEVRRRMTAILDGPRALSEELLVQLYVFRETNPERTDVLHLMTLVTHCVTDKLANNTLVRCLLDTLARGGGSEPVQIPLEDRLAMAVPPMELESMHLRSLSPARRRWRKAVGAVIFQLKMAKRQVSVVFSYRVVYNQLIFLMGMLMGHCSLL